MSKNLFSYDFPFIFMKINSISPFSDTMFNAFFFLVFQTCVQLYVLHVPWHIFRSTFQNQLHDFVNTEVVVIRNIVVNKTTEILSTL